jgi:hypothetical protein
VNRSERRAALFAKRREVCLAMGAAADVQHFEIAAEIARDANIDICPVCVSAACHYAQRVTRKGTSFWICETCATKHTAKRDHMGPVPLVLGRLQRDVAKRIQFAELYGARFDYLAKIAKGGA